MNVGDIFTKDRAVELPPGAVFEGRGDGIRRTVNADGASYRTRNGDTWNFTGLPGGHFVVIELPDTLAVGQAIDRQSVRRLPVGTVFTGSDGLERTVITEGATYADPVGRQRPFGDWNGEGGRVVRLPKPVVFTVGDIVTPAQLADLPDEAEVRVPGNGNHYFKRGNQMESVNGARIIDISNFTADATITSLPEVKEAEPYRHAVGDSRIDGTDLQDLPVGAVIRGDNDGVERTVVDGGFMFRGERREILALRGPYTIVSLPDQPKPAEPEFTVGQTINSTQVRRLPAGAVFTRNGRERTIRTDGLDGYDLNGNHYNWVSLPVDTNYVIESLPDAAVAGVKVGDLIRVGDTEGLRALPDGTEVEVTANGHRYVKNGDEMGQIGGGGQAYRLVDFHSEARIIWMPGMKKDTAWAVNQQVAAAQLINLPPGTTFKRVDRDIEYLTVEGHDARAGRAAGEGRVSHYVTPDEGIVSGGGLRPLADLRGDYIIVALPDDAVETLAEFEARLWRVLKPYRESHYTGPEAKRLMERLGITEPPPAPEPEDPALVQARKDEIWNTIAQEANRRGWCATWQKPLAELGISDPAKRPGPQVQTTIVITHDEKVDAMAEVRAAMEKINAIIEKVEQPADQPF